MVTHFGNNRICKQIWGSRQILGKETNGLLFRIDSFPLAKWPCSPSCLAISSRCWLFSRFAIVNVLPFFLLHLTHTQPNSDQRQLWLRADRLLCDCQRRWSGHWPRSFRIVRRGIGWLSAQVNSHIQSISHNFLHSPRREQRHQRRPSIAHRFGERDVDERGKMDAKMIHFKCRPSPRNYLSTSLSFDTTSIFGLSRRGRSAIFWIVPATLSPLPSHLFQFSANIRSRSFSSTHPPPNRPFPVHRQLLISRKSQRHQNDEPASQATN